MGEGLLKLLISNKQKVVNVDYNSVNRIEWLDATRGLAVLLVIWGHIDNGAVFTKSFYCFHIPLLFWISGFLLSVDRKPVTKFIHYKIKNIAIPCMMYSIIIVLVGIFIMNNNMYYELIPQILLQIRSWPLWYMACLFILNIMGYVVIQIEKGIKRRRFYRYAVCIISVVIGVVLIMEKKQLPWNIDIAFMAFPFFYVGYIDKKLFQSGRGLILQFTTSSKWMICSIILLMLSVIIGFCNKEICRYKL